MILKRFDEVINNVKSASEITTNKYLTEITIGDFKFTKATSNMENSTIHVNNITLYLSESDSNEVYNKTKI